LDEESDPDEIEEEEDDDTATARDVRPVAVKRERSTREQQGEGV
jgi:hypothetical protein